MKIGLSFSNNQTTTLELDSLAALDQVISLPIDIIRIPCYWNQIEEIAGNYNYREIQEMIKICSQQAIQVVLVVGMKSLRWPEYYLPTWLENQSIASDEVKYRTLKFIDKTIRHFKNESAIGWWQLENEPLDPSGPENLIISADFLKTESELIRSLDSRPIIITTWGNDIGKRSAFKKISKLADIIGVDLYYQQYSTTILGKSFYRKPDFSDEKLTQLFNSINKPIWITELQAEPWESSPVVYLSSNPNSFNLNLFAQNLARAKQLPVEAILLWGAEYWLWKNRQDSRYLDYVKRVLLA